MVYKEMVQAIIDLLRSDPRLEEPSKVRRYYFGMPMRVLQYPSIYVQWLGRASEGRGAKPLFYDASFEIGILDRSSNEDAAERSVYDMVEAVDAVLDANPSLNGLAEEVLLPRSVEVVAAKEGDYAIAYAKMIHVARRRV